MIVIQIVQQCPTLLPAGAAVPIVTATTATILTAVATTPTAIATILRAAAATTTAAKAVRVPMRRVTIPKLNWLKSCSCGNSKSEKLRNNNSNSMEQHLIGWTSAMNFHMLSKPTPQHRDYKHIHTCI